MSLVEFRKSTSLLREEWHKFIKYDKKQVEVRPAILSSWQRCKNLDVDPYGGESTKILHTTELADKLKQNENLISVTKLYMDKIYYTIKGLGYVVFLMDSEAWVLYIIGDKEVLRDFEDNLKFGIGVSWSEQVVGTTAVGMVLADGEPVPFIAEEKYCLKLKERACSAVPIKNTEGEIIGVLGVATSFQKVKKISCNIFGMLLAAEAAIENHLQIMKTNENLNVISNYYKAIFDSVSEAIVTVDCKGIITGINKSAGGILLINPEKAIGKHANEVLEFCPVALNVLGSGKGRQNKEVIIDSKHVKIYFNSVPIIRKNGEIDGVIGIFRETKEEKRLASKNSVNKANFTFEDIIGNSKEILEVKRLVSIAARESSNILLMGESGTGKELFAQAIHNANFRAYGPFVAVNCGAIPKELIESEFFGYDKGAFTGACSDGRPGKFELAAGGTIFLDEIGEMPKDLQVRLLRVLQEKEVTRVGGSKTIPVDVRVISATNKNLSKMVTEGTFREDLYWRLNVISINIPPLTQRCGDIPFLIEYFLEKHSRDRKEKYSLDKNTTEILLNYYWPGNVRELENVLERAVIFAENGIILPEHLPEYITSKPQHKKFSTENISLDEAEKQAIQQALDISRGNLSHTAKNLGIARNTLYCKMKKYHIGCYEN